MGRHDDALARELEFETSSDSDPRAVEVVGWRRSETGPRARDHDDDHSVGLCVVCGRARARLTITRRGHAPARVCLRCHHAVRQQRKMLRAELPARPAPGRTPTEPGRPGSAGSPPAVSRWSVEVNWRRHHLSRDAGLIVPKSGSLTGSAKYAELTHRRRRAQVAARRALDRGHEPVAEQDLFDRAS